MKKVILHPLGLNDLEMVLAWRNADNVRKNMYTNHKISWEEHVNWFKSIEIDETKEYFICYINSLPVGVIGFTEMDMSTMTASWAFYASVDAPRGAGSIMEFFALEYAFRKRELVQLNCEVLSFNQSVLKLHNKFGFKEIRRFEKKSPMNDDLINVVSLSISNNDWNQIADEMRRKLRL